MLKERRQIAAKIESVEGTAETLTASEAGILVFTPGVDIEIEQYKRNPARTTLSQMLSLSAKRSAKLKFRTELKGSGTAGTAPSWGPLMKACGFSETIVALTSVTYKPASSSIPSLTLACYEDGIIKKMWGCRGNVKLACKNGEPPMLDFEFTGADFSVTDGALLSPTYESVLPARFASAAVSVISHSAVISALDIDLQNTVALRQDVNKDSGYASAVITNRDPKMSIDPEMVLVGTADFFGVLRSGGNGALSMVIGALAGNIATITAPAVRYTKLGDSDREGIATLAAELQLAMSTGDDELSIALT